MSEPEALLKICCHYTGMDLPSRAFASDAGIDLTAMAFEQKREGLFLIDTGISTQISKGYYLEVIPRSSIVRSDFIMANSVGIIDPDFRGRISVPLLFLGHGSGIEACEKLMNKRVAQMLIRRLESCRIIEVEELDETERGKGGFGSTDLVRKSD